jgi:ketopantoate reductase
VRITVLSASATGSTVDSHLARAGTPVEVVDTDPAHEAVPTEAFENVEPSSYYPHEVPDWRLPNASLDQLVERRRFGHKAPSGIWCDIAIRHRRTEVDEQVGVALRIGREHGLSIRLASRAVEMIHEVESGVCKRTVHNIDELEHLRRSMTDVGAHR